VLAQAIFVKSNPGYNGTGEITNIAYRRIKAVDTVALRVSLPRPIRIAQVWMPLWIGPQQMQEPGTNGTGV
jgi:hypothetical protein